MTKRKDPPKALKKVGRPEVIQGPIFDKLREAFLMGCTDREACLYADIPPSTLYKYQDRHPEFVEQKEAWKDNPLLMARQNVHHAIRSGRVDTSQWYLEKKNSEEFGKKEKVEHSGYLGLMIYKPEKLPEGHTNKQIEEGK